jgi:multiple sugar transport system substrate-binding protein
MVCLVLLAGALGLAGCAPAAPGPTPADTATPAAATVAQVDADGSVSFMVFGDTLMLEAYQALATAYEAQYPGREVALVTIPDPADYRKRLAADLAAGTPSDVVILDYQRYAGFAAKGMLAPVEPYLKSSALIHSGDFYPQSLAPFVYRRALMCLPQSLSSPVIFYNKRLFDQAGLAYPNDRWTWDEFLRTALALTRDTDGDGQTDQYGLGIEASLQQVLPFIWQNRGTLVDDVARPQGLELNDPRTLKAVQWFVDLQAAHHVVPGAAAEAAEPSQNRFLNGRLGMQVGTRSSVPTYRQVTAFDWDVAPLPMNRGRRASLLEADGYCLPAAAPHRDAAWQFIEYASSAEGQTIVAHAGRSVPARIDVAESPAFLEPAARPAHSQVFLDAIPNLRAVPVVENWGDIELIASEEIERAFYGYATVPDAMKAAMRRSEEYFTVTWTR